MRSSFNPDKYASRLLFNLFSLFFVVALRSLNRFNYNDNCKPSRDAFFLLSLIPHIMRTTYGYALMTLRGLPKEMHSKQIDQILINGIEHFFETLGDHASILIPSFQQEAQCVQIYSKDAEASDSMVEHWTHLPASSPSIVSRGL